MPRGITRQRPVIECQTRRRRSDATANGNNSCSGPGANEATWQFTQEAGVMRFLQQCGFGARHGVSADLPNHMLSTQLTKARSSCQTFPGLGRSFPRRTRSNHAVSASHKGRCILTYAPNSAARRCPNGDRLPFRWPMQRRLSVSGCPVHSNEFPLARCIPGNGSPPEDFPAPPPLVTCRTTDRRWGRAASAGTPSLVRGAASDLDQFRGTAPCPVCPRTRSRLQQTASAEPP